MTLLADLGVTVEAAVHTDASAAVGIVRKSGLGKLRHLTVRYLWLQDQVAAGNMALHKVRGLVNPADLVTKHLAQAAVTKHFGAFDMWVELGRAESAPVLSSLRTAAVRDTPWSPSGSMGDTWAVEAEEALREHRKQMRKLFAPPARRRSAFGQELNSSAHHGGSLR